MDTTKKGYRMETERLILRKYKIEDLLDFYEYISSETVVKYEPYRPMTLEQAEQELIKRIENDEFIAVELKESHKLIGNVYLGKRDFHALELGYVFNNRYGKQGFATEACEELIRMAFACGTHRIYAECDPENKDSWHLLERLGFSNEAYLTKNVYFWTNSEDRPIWKDTMIYSMLNNSEES